MYKTERKQDVPPLVQKNTDLSQLVEKILALGFYPAIPEQMKVMKEKERGLCKPSNSSQRAIIWFCKVFTYFIS